MVTTINENGLAVGIKFPFMIGQHYKIANMRDWWNFVDELNNLKESEERERGKYKAASDRADLLQERIERLERQNADLVAILTKYRNEIKEITDAEYLESEIGVVLAHLGALIYG